MYYIKQAWGKESNNNKFPLQNIPPVYFDFSLRSEASFFFAGDKEEGEG